MKGKKCRTKPPQSKKRLPEFFLVLLRGPPLGRIFWFSPNGPYLPLPFRSEFFSSRPEGVFVSSGSRRLLGPTDFSLFLLFLVEDVVCQFAMITLLVCLPTHQNHTLFFWAGLPPYQACPRFLSKVFPPCFLSPTRESARRSTFSSNPTSLLAEIFWLCWRGWRKIRPLYVMNQKVSLCSFF